jgi:hypothetical protein
VHEAFDLSGSVAIAHLASLQAEQVAHISVDCDIVMYANSFAAGRVAG